jgi:hypothetical protein
VREAVEKTLHSGSIPHQCEIASARKVAETCANEMAMPNAEAPSAEYIQILLSLISGDGEGAERLMRSHRASMDDLLLFAATHGLSVAVSRALENSPLRASCSASAVDKLERRAQERGARSLRLLGDLERLGDIFTTAGQRFMLLKGPYFAQRFYGHPQGRDYSDLDLLVPALDRIRAFQLLRDAGYSQRSRVLLGTRMTCYFVHAFDFTRDNSMLDLHWRLSRHPSFRIDEARMWAGAQTYEVGGRRYDVLSDEYEIVFAIVSILRDLERQSFKIKTLVDLMRILEALDQHVDWEAFFEQRVREGTLGPSVNVLGLCLDVAGGEGANRRLRAALKRHADRRVYRRQDISPFVFAPASFGIGNKLWCAEVYDASRASAFLWWGVSLPFRVAAHRSIRRRKRGTWPPLAAEASGKAED